MSTQTDKIREALRIGQAHTKHHHTYSEAIPGGDLEKQQLADVALFAEALAALSEIDAHPPAREVVEAGKRTSERLSNMIERFIDGSKKDRRPTKMDLQEWSCLSSNLESANDEFQDRLPQHKEVAPTVDIHAIAEDLTAHLAKMSPPTDPNGWKVIVRIALIARLTKLLTNP